MKSDKCNELTGDRDGAILVPGDDGSIHVVHGGEINPADVGDVSDSQKCTIVDWDPATNEWVSWLRNGKEIFREKDRKVVVRFEHIILAGMIARGERIPDDNFASSVAWHCRRRWAKLKNKTKKILCLIKAYKMR